MVCILDKTYAKNFDSVKADGRGGRSHKLGLVRFQVLKESRLRVQRWSQESIWVVMRWNNESREKLCASSRFTKVPG